MIEQTKPKKSVLQTKHGTTNLRSLKTNNNRGHKSFDATIQNHSATKFPSENTNIPDHSLYNYTPYNCLSKSLALRKSANFSSTSAWDINGNLRNNVDRPLFPKSLKKSCSQLNQSNAILPSISSYLNRARCCRSSKSSEVQACTTDEARRKLDSVQFFAINLPEASHGVFDQRYITNCPIKCRLHSVGNSGLNALRSNNLYSVDHSGWNSVEELGLRMNEVFNVTNENCNGNCVSYDPRTIYRNQQHIPTGNNIDTSRLTNLQTLSDSNRQFVNCISCANCYRCLGVNGTKQSRTPVPFSDQCNGLTVGPGIRQQASYGPFPQQLLQNGLKPGVMSQQLDSCYAEPSSNQQPCVETWRIPGYRNGSLRNSNYLSNQATDSSQKVQGASYEDRVDHWSRLNPSLPYENLLRAMTYPNGVFVENGQQLEQNAQDGAKSFMRPILKGSNNANIKVNY
ncbi:uncharacterized protein LOC128885858 [Hylaeus anthracinus]|uniref:uncharacterized protein LOC128885858 n=1 Tax=Hylaeus anthracinus TaxID=313031 RepID=UPI0023B8DD86|nr:uncharacterized protein LOC128885858 [Hylaeus anthracinus]